MTQEEINNLPPEQRLEALNEKVAEIQEERPDLADSVVSEDPETWQDRVIAKLWWAPAFFKVSFFLMLLAGAYKLVTIDRLPEEYRPARAAQEKAIKAAEIQYRIDVANVDLKKLTNKK